MTDNEPHIAQARFSVGDIVSHKLFGYRGVVFDADAQFQLSEEWYQTVALSRPPKDQPWYHLLVDGASHTTYVAERNLEPDDSDADIRHPLIDKLFSERSGGRYHGGGRVN